MADNPENTTSPDDPGVASSSSAETTPKKPKRRRGRRILYFGLAAAMVMAAFDIIDTALTFYGDGAMAEDRLVVVERGSTLAQTSLMLENEDVISSDRVFNAVARLYGADRDLKAGEYMIPAHASMYDVMTLLREGRVVTRQLTVAEGLSVKQITALLEEEEALSGAIEAPPTEGSLLPETYHIIRGDTRAAVIERMQRAMTHALDAAWAERQPDLPFDTKEEAVILASIVEKETSVPAERPRIAGVFINRLRKGMPLQSDPTIVYGITGGTPLGRRIRRSEIDAKTPYNTYHFVGLPPAPIANPGIDSIKAVLNPDETDELFFVADGTGGHAFAKTYREHRQNVRKWRQIRDR